MSVCSLISLSVSLCVLASSAGPSRYHGDESRHRQSAIISYTLPTEFLLYSPLVYICVLSLHSHTFSVSTPISPTPLLTSHQSPFLLPSQWVVESSLRCLVQQKATRSNGTCSRWRHNQYDPPMSHLATAFFICPCERSIVITLSTPSLSLLPRSSLLLHPFLSLPSWSFIPLFVQLLPAPFLKYNQKYVRRDRAQHCAYTENLPIHSDMDVDTPTHTHTPPPHTQLQQILLTGYTAVLCVIRLLFTPVSSNHFDQWACDSQMKLQYPTRVCMIRWPSQSD